MKTRPKPTITSKSADRVAIWTIGHSNRTEQAFLELLDENKIEALVDVRSFPTSRIQHFKRDDMELWLQEQRIEYVWMGKELGGYRVGGYRAHMRTKLFREGITRLLRTAMQKRTCIMCMESNPRHCHRRYISEYLEGKEIEVRHIVAKGQARILRFGSVLADA